MQHKQRWRPRDRTVLMVPVGSVAFVLVLASTASACGVLTGRISLKGSHFTTPEAIYEGSNAGHFVGAGNGLAAVSCVINVSQPTTGSGNDCPEDLTIPSPHKGNAYVDIKLEGGSAGSLPASTTGYGHCPSASGDVVWDQRCALGTSPGAPPPVGIQNNVGAYLVNLVQAQWLNNDSCPNNGGACTGPPPDSDFDPGSGCQPPIPGACTPAQRTGDRVSGKMGTSCANGADQSVRVVHLGLAEIDGSGRIGGAPTSDDVNRLYVHNRAVPSPKAHPTATNYWRYYLPTTNLIAETQPRATPPAQRQQVLANSICVTDRYGMYSIEAPLQLFTV